MKTTHTNKSNEMQQVMFKDNTSVFLKRGESHTSDKEVHMKGKGVVSKETRPTKRRAQSEE